MTRSIVILFLALTLAVNSEGRVTWKSTLEAVPNTVAGTLSPLTITLDAVRVFREEKPASALKLNGSLVTTSNDEGSSFFRNTLESPLIFTLISETGTERTLKKITLPAVKRSKFQNRSGEIQVTSGVKILRLDNREIPLKKKTGRFPIPDEAWYQSVHVLEVISEAGYKRRYNLVFESVIVAEKSQEERAPAATPTSMESIPSAPSQTAWGDFSLGMTWFTQEYGAAGTYPYLAWVPSGSTFLGLEWLWETQVHPIKRRDSGYTAILGSALHAGVSLDILRLFVGAGAQAWIGYGGIRPILQTRALIPVPWIHSRLQAALGYGALLDENFTNQITFSAVIGF